MNVYAKLQAARKKLHQTPLSKSGKNKFANFNYFELGDFVPQVTAIFDELGLCGVVNFTNDTATMTVYDTATDGSIVFTTPLVHAHMEKVQAIQSLGATHTYMRRYLWLMTMDIVENDAVDAVEPKEKPAPKATPAPAPKPAPAPAPKAAEPKQLDMSGKPGPWQIVIKGEGEWDALMTDACALMLDVAATPEDCVDIFKINHSLFEKMKQEYPEAYKLLMSVFKARKESLTPKE